MRKRLKKSKSSSDDVEKQGQISSRSDETEWDHNSKNPVKDTSGFEIRHLEGSDIPVIVRPHSWFIRNVFGTKVKPVPSQRQPAPQGMKNPLNAITWQWVSSILKVGFNRILEPNDIFYIPENSQCSRRMAKYHKKLNEYKTAEKRTAYAEFWAMIYAIKWNFINTVVVTALSTGSEICMTVISRKMILAVNDIYNGQTTHHGKALGFALGMTAIQIFFQVTLVWEQFMGRSLAETGRTLVIAAVYNKMTKLSPTGRQLYPASKITSIVTTDTNRIFMALRWTAMVIVFLPAFGAMLGILIYNLGVSALPGAGLVLLGICCNVAISKVITKLRQRSLPYADKRIAIVRETVENMRIIKFYGWETSFVSLVAKARNNETGFLKKLGIVEGLIDAFLTSIPYLGGVLAFTVRIVTKHNLPAYLAFPSLTLFGLFVPISMMFSSGLVSHADAWASVKRLEEFFKAPEEPTYVISEGVPPGTITIEDGAFTWECEQPTKASKRRWKHKLWFYQKNVKAEDSQIMDRYSALTKSTNTVTDNNSDKNEKLALNGNTGAEFSEFTRAGARKFPGLIEINMKIKPKELVMITGPIGSGKTTLLHAIVGSISKKAGSVKVGGRVSTVMSMWSQNATIRDNITFGTEYDAKRYAQSVYACSLETDFDNLAGRDLSEVGERGITLSGGQKARIALARCVYNGGDVILLDDVLSAVDGRVSNHIFNKCIKELSKSATVVMTTHNANLLHHADRVIYMTGDGRAHIDSLTSLLASQPEFARTFYDSVNKNSNVQSLDEEAFEEAQEKKHSDIQNYEENLEVYGAEINPNIDEKGAKESDSQAKDFTSISPEIPEKGAKLMQDELRLRGTIKGDVLYKYLSSGSSIGIFFVAVILVAVFSVAVSNIMQSVFMQFWTSDKYNKPSGYYLGFFTLIVCCRAFCFVIMAVCICTFCFNSSSKLHNNAVKTIYKAPMSYFDSTPLGRIINRFTDDVANLDTQLFMQLRFTLFSFSMLMASIIVVFVYVPWAILALVPIIIAGFILLNYYRASARELKRINSLFRSQMFTLITEMISGITVILNYHREKTFIKKLNQRIDDMNISYQINLASQFWLAMRMSVLSVIVSLIVLLLAVYQVFNLDASKVGLMMNLLPQVSLSISILLPMLADLENQLNSVERLHELAYDLPQEAAFEIPETLPPNSWPEKGSISMEEISMRYRPDLPLVINKLSLHVNANEKIGICGRTGAGKSTILSVLFRISELCEGRIVIDGIDISTIGLRELRSKLAIIPQDPVLFRGTIRSNLDPFNEHSDEELWSSLRRAGVIRPAEVDTRTGTVNSSHRFHLDSTIDSDGSNFSLGERQLLTLARALVRNARIIALDEATATVDYETDKMIQRTIAKEFSNCTILCIAHRLQTILHYDRVMIMDAGKIVEIGPPKELFDNKESIFRGMCEESGVSKVDFNNI